MQLDQVLRAIGLAFSYVLMKDLLKELTKMLKHNNTIYENYHWIFSFKGYSLKEAPKEPLRDNVLFQHM